MEVILNPLSADSSFTVAVVLTRLAGCLAFSRLNESAMEKQPASAAPMSSSGFVPFPSSKRDENEYGPSNAPLPSFMVPLPCFKVPSQTADPVRVAIVLPPLFLVLNGSRGNSVSATQAGSGAAMSPSCELRSFFSFASASSRCLRPSQMLSVHQIAPTGTATQEMPTNPRPNHRINGSDQAPTMSSKR